MREEFVLVQGPGSPKTFVFSDLVLGRSNSVDVVLGDSAVSRRHATIQRSGDSWRLTDLGSANGLFLNGTKIRAGTLQDGDIFEVGPFAFLARLTSRSPNLSAFISYGGPDEMFAVRLSEALTHHGIRTFVFKKDALPGKRIDRVMREGVNEYDRMILVCSGASLERPGVLAELTEILARESRDGGAEYLIPIRLDDYLFATWKPVRADLKQAIVDRVVADFSTLDNFDQELTRLVRVLRGERFVAPNTAVDRVTGVSLRQPPPALLPPDNGEETFASNDGWPSVALQLAHATIRARQLVPTTPCDRVTELLVQQGIQRALAEAAVTDALRNHRRRG